MAETVPGRTQPTRRPGIWADFRLAATKGLNLLLSGKLFHEPGNLRRVLKKGRWLLIRHLGIEEVVLPFLHDLKLCVRTSDNIIACDVYLDGQFGYREFSAAMGFLGSKGYFSLSGTIFVDVGANIGTHTLYALRSGSFARVISLEPERCNFELLLRNLRINGFQIADARNVGLSEASSDAILKISPDNFGDHRIARVPSDAGITASLQRVALADFTTMANDLQVDASHGILFWIDTQGHEYEVLSGIGRRLLRENAFVTEFWPSLLQANGTLERFIALAEEVAGAYLILQQPDALHELADLAGLSDYLLKQRHPADQLDILFIGRGSSISQLARPATAGMGNHLP